MLLALLACQLALVAANPLHKYPYVFLLDVGNEELEKTNTEQIRLSVPGGSIAIKYPAVGTGDTIAHIRVSGIDFGTDLKSNIVEGGPGYKYVVMVFMGNEGVPYDAVMTIETVPDEYIDESQSNDVSSSNNYYSISEDNSDSGEIPNNSDVSSAEDENVSAENTSDELDDQCNESKSAEILQQSSNVYTYADSEADNDETDEKDIHKQYSDSNFDDQRGISDDDNNENESNNEPERSQFIDDYGNENDNDNESENTQTVNNKAYEKYQPAIPLRAYGGLRIYPQNAVPFALPNSDNSVYSPDNAVHSDHETNDNDDSSSDKYADSNNNYFDLDEAPAVAS